jgi:putative permease
MKRIAWTSFLVLATLTALVLLWQFLEAVVIFLLALTLAAIVGPAVEHLQRRGMPRGAATGLVYLAFLLAGISLLLPIGILVGHELQQAIVDFGVAYEHIDSHWSHGNSLQQLIAERLPSLEDVPKTLADLPRAVVAERVLGLGQGLFELFIGAGVAFVLSFYWRLDSQRLERLWLSLLPLDERTRAQTAWRQIETQVGAYMRSELLQSLMAGAVLAVLFWLVGFPYPATIALIAALAWLVPWLGPAIAVAAVWIAVALNFVEATLLDTLTRGAVGSLFVLGVFALLELLVEPRLVQQRQYSSLLVVLIVLGLVDLVGIATGLILGPPVAVMIQILLRSYFWQTAEEPEGEPIEDLSVLRQQVARVREELREADEAWAVQMENILDRLSALLDDARESMLSDYPSRAANPPAESS